MSYGEAWRLTLILIGDTASQIGAAVAGWSHPATREALAVMDLYDLQHQSKAKRKPIPYPRPWIVPLKPRGDRSLSVAAMRALLDNNRTEALDG